MSWFGASHYGPNWFGNSWWGNGVAAVVVVRVPEHPSSGETPKYLALAIYEDEEILEILKVFVNAVNSGMR